jgi:hypothetical protein
MPERKEAGDDVDGHPLEPLQADEADARAQALPASATTVGPWSSASA